MNCQFCDFSGSDIDVLAHVSHAHNGHPSFSVSCKLCGGTWKKYECMSHSKGMCFENILDKIQYHWLVIDSQTFQAA